MCPFPCAISSAAVYNLIVWPLGIAIFALSFHYLFKSALPPTREQLQQRNPDLWVPDRDEDGDAEEQEQRVLAILQEVKNRELWNQNPEEHWGVGLGARLDACGNCEGSRMSSSESEAASIDVGDHLVCRRAAQRASDGGAGARFPKPSQRSACEHNGVMALAREGKLRKRVCALKCYIRHTLVSLADSLRHRAIVRTGVAIVVCKNGRDGVAEMKITGRGSAAIASNVVLGVAFSNNMSRNQLSQVYGVAKTSIDRCRALAASVYMQLQTQAISYFSSAWTAVAAAASTTTTTTTNAVSFSMSVCRFDETSERLSLPIGNQLKPHQQMSSWHVLVCRRAGAVGILDDISGEWPKYLELLIPNTPLTSTSASCVFDGLFKHAMVSENVASFENMILQRRSPNHGVFYTVECDSASSNFKMAAHRFNMVCEDNPKALVCVRPCSCHQTSIEAAIVLHLGAELASRCFSMASLIKSRGYFVRMVKALPKVLDDMVVVRYLEAPPAEDDPRRMLMRELASFSVGLYQVVEHAQSDAEKHTARESYANLWSDLLAIVSWASVRDRRLFVYSDGSKDPATIKEELRKILVRTLLSHQPTTPIMQKWPKLGPGLDWFCQLVLFGNLSGLLFRAAFEGFVSGAGARAGVGAGSCQDDDDPEVVVRATCSRRVVRGQEFLSSEACLVALPIACLALEVTRRLTAFFLRVQRAAGQETETPGLAQLANTSASPVLAALQSISSLLAGKGSRLILIFMQTGATSLEQWCEDFPLQAMQLRSSLTLGAAWIFERLHRTSMDLPFRLAAFGDANLPDAEAKLIVERFFNMPFCCTPWGVSKVLRQELADGDLLQPVWRQLLHRWSGLFWLSVGDIECRHARNRRAARPGMCWSSFSNVTLNQEAKAMHEAALKRHARRREQEGIAIALVAKPGRVRDVRDGPIRRKRALEIFREDLIKRKRAGASPLMLVCSSAFWEECKQEFANLPEESKNEYERRSVLSGVQADLNRRRLKALRAAPADAPPPPIEDQVELPRARLHVRGTEAIAPWIGSLSPTPSPIRLERFNDTCSHHGRVGGQTFSAMLGKHCANNRAFCTDSPSVLHKVDYHDDHCGAFCKSSSPAFVLRMATATREWLCKITAKLSQAEVSRTQRLFDVEVFHEGEDDAGHDEGPASMSFGCLAGCCPAHGRHMAKHLFIACGKEASRAQLEAYLGLRLRFARHPCVQQQPAPHPPFDSAIGMLHHVGRDEWLRSAIWSRERLPRRVVVRRLLYRPLLLDKFTTQGCDETAPPSVMTDAGVEQPLVDPGLAMEEDEEVEARAEDESSGSEVDFFSSRPERSAEHVARQLATEVAAIDEDFEALFASTAGDEEQQEYRELHASVEEAIVPDSSEDAEGLFAEDIGVNAGVGSEEEEEEERHLPLEVRRAEAMELYDHETDIASLCDFLHITIQSWRIRDSSTNQALGRLNSVHGWTLAGTCMPHGETCKLWRNFRSQEALRQLELDMVKFFVAGISRALEEHRALTTRTKAAWQAKGL